MGSEDDNDWFIEEASDVEDAPVSTSWTVLSDFGLVRGIVLLCLGTVAGFIGVTLVQQTSPPRRSIVQTGQNEPGGSSTPGLTSSPRSLQQHEVPRTDPPPVFSRVAPVEAELPVDRGAAPVASAAREQESATSRPLVRAGALGTVPTRPAASASAVDRTPPSPRASVGGRDTTEIRSVTSAEATAVPEASPPSLAIPAGARGDSAARVDRLTPIPAVPDVVDRSMRSTPPIEAPSAASSAASTAREEDDVRRVLRDYAEAYRKLDVSAAAAVWPSVDRTALSRAFSTLQSQDLEFETCDVDATDLSAVVRCRGRVQYVTKVGGRSIRSERQEWLFKMEKRGTRWQIEQLTAVR